MARLIVLLTLTAAPALSALDGDWTLTFEDDFAGGTLNASTWTPAENFTHATYNFEPGEPLPAELQLYTRDSVYVENGTLVLETAWRPGVAASYGRNGRNWTSGWVDSKATAAAAIHVQRRGRGGTDVERGQAAYAPAAGFSQTFGRFEVRAKLPSGASFPSIWPALWMMPLPAGTVPPNLCWPAGGEIDIMEMWGGMHGSQVTSTMHWTASASPKQCGHSFDRSHGHVGVYPDVAKGAAAIDFSAAFHDFALVWNATAMEFYVDDVLVGETHSGDGTGIVVPKSPFYFIFNTAICGGTWCDNAAKYGPVPGQGAAPVKMVIDRVRAYQKQK